MAEPVSFGEAYREAGGRFGHEPVAFPLTHERIRDMARLRERVLRLQFEGHQFPPEDETLLSSLSLDHPNQCWLRYLHLRGMWHVWEKGYQRRDADHDLNEYLLLHREPVRVRIGARVVEVTSRSRAAMIMLARHSTQRRLLSGDLERIEGLLLQRITRRRRRFLVRMLAAATREWEYQFRGILACLLTPDGRAALPEEAPEWWDEVTVEDEKRLLIATLEAGPGRYRRLGPPPAVEGAKKPEEEFGPEHLLATWEPKLNLPPATLCDRDYAQFVTWLRAGAASGSESQRLERAFG